MLTALGRFAAAHPRKILVTTLILLIGAGALGFGAFGKLKPQGFTDPDAESSQAQELITEHFGGEADLIFLVTAADGTVDSPAARAAGARLTRQLADEAALSTVRSYWTTGSAAMRSGGGDHALILGHTSDAIDATEAVQHLRERYGGARGPITVDLGGRAAVQHDIGNQVQADLLVAESIAVPLILLLLVVAFGSLVAALLPLAIGGIAVLGTFAELAVLGSLTDVSIYAINLTTALGLGLAIDYALLMVSRFREQLAAGDDPRAAVLTTVTTAGRTIVFSAATVAVALAALLLFPLYFLRSFAYAGIGVIVVAALGAILVLPALLSILGSRVNAGRLPWKRHSPSTVSGFWARVSGAITRRPALAAVPALILVLATLPLFGVRFGTPDERVLPESAASRVVGDTLRTDFPDSAGSSIEVVTTGGLDRAGVDAYTGTLSAIPGVAEVSVTARRDAHLFRVTPAHAPRSKAAQHLVDRIRSLPGPDGTQVKVGGETAVLVDSKAAIGDRLPVALTLIALSTFVLLFLFTGSLLQPLRALLFNLLGLSATLGILVLIFQEGFLSGLFGFTPLPLDTSMLMLLFCIVFGLSMDYEVFVLSRIKEAHNKGLQPRAAVIDGLSRTGRIVSTAAVLLAVSFFAFGTSGVSFIQMFGIGSGLAVLIDATIIRGVLLPAGIRLLGNRAWWAPGPLRRLHNRIGIHEHTPSEQSPRALDHTPT